MVESRTRIEHHETSVLGSPVHPRLSFVVLFLRVVNWIRNSLGISYWNTRPESVRTSAKSTVALGRKAWQK